MSAPITPPVGGYVTPGGFIAVPGPPGADGADGTSGTDGASAYDLWLAQGNVGSLDVFLKSLEGPAGVPGDPVPTITGDPVVGSVLTCSGDNLDAYQWLRNGAAIAGATQKTYTLTAADSGKSISCLRTPSAAPVLVTDVGPLWQPDPTGLFGGQQVIAERAGMYAQGAIGTSANWNNNSRRAHEASWSNVIRVTANNIRLLWINGINDQDPSQVNNGVPSLGLVQATCQTQMGLVLPDGVTVDALDLRDMEAPGVSLGNGEAPVVNVAIHKGVFGVPPVPRSVSKGDVIKERIYVDRGNDTANYRFPVQASMNSTKEPNSEGASENVTGPGTSHVHASVATWDALPYGALGFVAPTAVVGTPTNGPVANVLGLGDSIPNRSLDDITNQPDYNVAYIKRAIKMMADGGRDIVYMSITQGNETLQNLLMMLQDLTKERRKLLAAGCWTHIHLDHGHNDVQNGRTSAQVIADFQSTIALVRSIVPAHSKISMNTMVPYTDASNNRLANAVMDDILNWQLSGSPEVDWVADGGALVASASDRQRWASTALGDAFSMIQEGIHPGPNGHIAMANMYAANDSYWNVA